MLNLALPAPLCGAERGTFAEDTILHRLPGIARRVLSENTWQPVQQARLAELIAEIPHAPLRPLREGTAPDVRSWNRALSRLAGKDWLETPWFVAEMYFFRRILEATGYYQPGSGLGQDPYALQKQQGLADCLPAVRAAAEEVQRWVAQPAADSLAQMLKLSLWGNQVDLSLWPAGQAERPNHASWKHGEAFLLSDQAAEAAAHLTSQPPGRIDVLVDNAGQELAFDLLLTDFLLTSSAARRVRLHLKPHPTYVSDATQPDVREAVAAFRGQAGALEELGGRLQAHLDSGRLQLSTDYFWTLPYAAWELPSRLQHSLRRARLVISKGDANYRRLVGDRHWAFDTPFAQITSYFPAPLLALRVCKSEVMAGLAPGQAEAMSQQDPAWLTNGRWGIIQYSPQL
jgi:hypothetical protein